MQGNADTPSGADTNVRHMTDPTSEVNLNIGLLVGSHATVARLLDGVATVPGLAGVLLTFDEFVTGTEIFGSRIQSLMPRAAASSAGWSSHHSSAIPSISTGVSSMSARRRSPRMWFCT